MHQKQGDRATLSLSTPRTTVKPQPKFDYGKKRPSGAQRILSHDKDLKKFKESREEVMLMLVSGRKVKGIIVDSDKYSLKIKEFSSGVDLCFFKHAIESFGLAPVEEATL